MFFKLFHSKARGLALGLIVATFSNAQMVAEEAKDALIAKGKVHQFVASAQADVSDTTTITAPAINTPFTYSMVNLIKDVETANNNSEFIIQKAGLYFIETRTTLNQTNFISEAEPIVGIYINGQSFLNFQSGEFTNFIINDFSEATAHAELYLEKGDKVTVAMVAQSDAPSDIVSRALTIYNLNNTKH